ncbi:MAG: acyl-CoA desaturase [Verrucomicrobia bacterium]|nr:acyl-CoA desaturase [Verrucomicrobiota bacterium]
MALNYALLLSGFGGPVGFFLSFVAFGFMISIGTMNISHDAQHGAYAKTNPGNRILSLLMDLFGASSFYWKKEHTIDHHTFTNIDHHDADLGVPYVLRLCPNAPRKWFHRFQHIYAPFLYAMNLIRWVYYSDTKRIWNIIKLRNKAPGNPSDMEIFLLIAFKFIHIFLFVAVPIMILPFAWWFIVLGYFTFLATAGLVLTVIFQLAHIVENVAFPLPNEEGKIDNSFLKHQLATTANFAMDSRLANFLFGGLNFQVEHHIFPHVCHTHLRKIAPIVRSTAHEFGLPYNENPTFMAAIASHFKTLKKLGRST